MITRTYTKTVIPEKLQQEIEAEIPDILDSITTTEGDTVKLALLREPSGTEDSLLTSLVNSHVATYNGYKIWQMLGHTKPMVRSPENINFDLLPLAVHKTYNKGEEDVITYYRSAEISPDGSIAYSDPILKATWTWTHDLLNFPIYAEEKVEWYRLDDTIGPVAKVIPHYFDGLHKIRKGKEARATLIDDMQIPVSEMLVYNETVRRAGEEGDPSYQLTLEETEAAIQIGRDFLTDNQDTFNAYIQHRDLEIINMITNDSTSAFLDWVNPYDSPNTIRDYILSSF